ncbi:MAG: TIGR03619 family F420-dependent LLM class oxidoreductase [Alphaproteobacteria bacterium]|nr:TIGR03619 family F420-dependent LLM class oxidoreductase [Alphaproteobacteria bacterium]
MASIAEFGLDVGVYGPLATPGIVLGLARQAEEIGFGAVWLADHVAFPVQFKSQYPYSATGDFPTRLAEPLLEPVALMGVIAGATQRVKIGTAVLVMPYRNPVLLARMLATIDNLSGGRVILGAGTGWLEEEFQVLNTHDFAKRGRVTDEYLEIFKAICGGGEVAYRGETYAFEPIFCVPGSVQRPHPPILVGGVADAALRRVAKHADGWLAVTIGTQAIPERLAKLKQFCQQQGRSFDSVQLAYKLFLNIGEAKRSKFDAREPGTGSLAEIIDDLKALKGLGFSHFVVRYRGASAAEQSRQIAGFTDEVIPKV